MLPSAACIYSFYERTFRTAERAVADGHERQLDALADAVQQLDRPRALLATIATFDAMDRFPLRSRGNVRRLAPDGICSCAECGAAP